MVISQFGGTQLFFNFLEHGLSQFGLKTVFFQFCGTWSFLNLVEHTHFSILWNMVICTCFLIWNMVISKFDGTWSFLNLLYLGLSLGVELKGFDLCQFGGTQSFFNFFETWSFLNLWKFFFNSVEHGHFYIFPDLVEHGHF